MGEDLTGARVFYTDTTPNPDFREQWGAITGYIDWGAWSVKLDRALPSGKDVVQLATAKSYNHVRIFMPYTEEDVRRAKRDLDEILGACDG